MKKMICILIVISVIFASVFSVFASDIWADLPKKTEYKYFDRLAEDVSYRPKEYIGYREYCHYSDENSEEPDWALIVCAIEPEPWAVKFGAVVGNRVLYQTGGPGQAPFYSGIAVYVPEVDEFFDLTKRLDEIIELCPDFVETIEKEKFGSLIGDMNWDDKISILDATIIQRCIADNSYSEEFDAVLGGVSVADFNRDDSNDIMDATAIQRYLVQG